METIIKELIVNDFEFIIGLDSFYREKMKKYEVKILLPLIKEIFQNIDIQKKNFPIEGYYYENEDLTEYFNYVKTLKTLNNDYKPKIENMQGYKKLLNILCSGLYGNYYFNESILPITKDPIYRTLENLSFDNWKSEKIIKTAFSIIKEENDFSIISLGIIKKDPIILTALRESVALYSDIFVGSAPNLTVKYEYKYIWNVSNEIQNKANNIIEIFNGICPYKIPIAEEKNVKKYYDEYVSNPINIRCIRIGIDNIGKNYHWAIINTDYLKRNYKFKEFWDSKFWTTETLKKDSKKLGELIGE